MPRDRAVMTLLSLGSAKPNGEQQIGGEHLSTNRIPRFAYTVDR
jgi:hypothetical protein